MSITEWLETFFAELERLADNRGTRHMLSTSNDGKLEIRIGVGDWYVLADAPLSDDPVMSARAAAMARRRDSSEFGGSGIPDLGPGKVGSRWDIAMRILGIAEEDLSDSERGLDLRSQILSELAKMDSKSVPTVS